MPVRSLILIALLSAVAGCSRDNASIKQVQTPAKPSAAAAAPVPITPVTEAPSITDARIDELMGAIFGADYRIDSRTALAYIPDEEDVEGIDYWRMSLRAAKELPDGRTVVVVNGTPSDAEGADHAGHASPGMLNVYTLRRADGKWQVLERYENVSMLGSHGRIGSVKWIDLGSGKPGILMSSGGTWQGYTVSNADIFDLDRDMRSLGGFAEYSGNEGACGPGTDNCWEVEGTIGTVPAARPDDYRDIVVAFKGKHYRVTEDANRNYVEHPTRSVSQTARYRFNGKKYVLVSGINPVPEV